MKTATESIFEGLPGQEVKVKSIAKAVADLWHNPEDLGQAPSEFRASQMNLIIHFGRGTTLSEAREKFGTALRFSQRYPCRIIALCPDPRPPEEFLLRAKVYGQCYVGKSRREMSCCEAIVLAYPKESKDFLEDQVSILLEGDLPIYYWIHHFTSAAKVPDYFSFLSKCKRVVYDSGVEAEDFGELPWPPQTQVRDMVYARLLPVRQMIGQFMSSYAPAAIVDELDCAVLRCGPRREADGRVLRQWLASRLEACAGGAPVEVKLEVGETAEKEERMTLELRYKNSQSLCWEADFSEKRAEIAAHIGGLQRRMPMPLELLSPAKELGEAFFF